MRTNNLIAGGLILSYHRIMFRLFIILFVLISGQSLAQCGACQFETNLVVNGAFSSGNTGFSSDLDYVTGIFTCPLCPENTYTIGANAIFYHSDFIGSDHTNPPTGNFFIANGPGQSGSQVWCQSITVQPNTDYVFTFWAQDVTNNNNPHPTALLQASFNGVLGTDTLNADGGWESLEVTWNSGESTTLDLCIVNQQSQTGGNDFGLDDISLVGCHAYHLSHAPFAGNDTTICSNQSAMLGTTAHADYNYTWNNPVGLSSVTVSNPDCVLSNTSGSNVIYEYILTTDSAGVGCLQSDTVLVTVLSAPAFSLGPDIIICPGESTSLDAGSGWSSVLWSTNSSAQQIDAAAGEYSVEVGSGICMYADTIIVAEQPMPVIDLGEDQIICETTPATLDAGVEGLWNTGVIAASIVVDQTGNYEITYTSGNCSTSDEVAITVYDMPLISLPADTIFCEGNSITLDAGITGLWNTGESASSIAIAAPGYYDIAVENGPCMAVSGTLATMLLLPYAQLPEDTLVCDGTYVTLETEADQNDSYLWSTGDTISSIAVQEAGVYEVSVFNECGVSDASIYIDTYLCGWDVFIPNSFTPDEDGVNDSWYLLSYNLNNIKIFIYNRLGNLIFYTTNPDEPWTPSLGVGDDVYNYRVEAITFENEPITLLGHIYLLR